MITDARILIIDDDEDIIFSLRVMLDSICSNMESTIDPRDIPSLIRRNSYDVVLLDMNFNDDAISGEEGFYWLSRIKEINPELPVILITAYGDIERAIRAIHSGAYDFITKPWQNEKIIATVNAATNYARAEQKVNITKAQRDYLKKDIEHDFSDIIGDSEVMQGVLKTVRTVASTEADVLIIGENGTGKELIARALHKNSNRADEVFLSVDMGAVNGNLFESELFGHVKGAFTGANKSRVGKLVAANGGTLFLDEIGNLALEQQVKLLKVLEDRQNVSLGSNVKEEIDVRLISATNSNLDLDVEEGKFRADLLFRINTIEIHLPPLRDRLKDVPKLCNYFLELYNNKYNKQIKGLTNSALSKLMGYHFPGNIRELKHIIHRAVILCEDKAINSNHINLKNRMKGSKLKLDTLNIEAAEEALIREAIQKYQGNMTKAAKALGINRTSLYRRIEKYGL